MTTPYGEPPRLTADAATWRAEDAEPVRHVMPAAEELHDDMRSKIVANLWNDWRKSADALESLIAAEVTAAREQGQNETAKLRADLDAAQAKVARVEVLRDRLRVADHHSGLNYHHGTRYADWLTSALDGPPAGTDAGHESRGDRG